MEAHLEHDVLTKGISRTADGGPRLLILLVLQGQKQLGGVIAVQEAVKGRAYQARSNWVMLGVTPTGL